MIPVSYIHLGQIKFRADRPNAGFGAHREHRNLTGRPNTLTVTHWQWHCLQFKYRSRYRIRRTIIYSALFSSCVFLFTQYDNLSSQIQHLLITLPSFRIMYQILNILNVNKPETWLSLKWSVCDVIGENSINNRPWTGCCYFVQVWNVVILRKMFVYFRAIKVLNLSEKEDGENTSTTADIVHL